MGSDWVSSRRGWGGSWPGGGCPVAGGAFLERRDPGFGYHCNERTTKTGIVSRGKCGWFRIMNSPLLTGDNYSLVIGVLQVEESLLCPFVRWSAMTNSL